MKKYSFIILSIILIITACSGNGVQSEPEVASGLFPQIHVVPTGQEKSLLSQETIDQKNCDGTAEMSQEISRSHTVLYTLELGSGVKVEADGRAKIPEIGEVGIGVEIASNYQVGYGHSDTVSRSQTVAAAPDSHIQHTIQQYEIWETGEVLIILGDINQRLPYRFRRDFSIEAAAPANIICPGISSADEKTSLDQSPRSEGTSIAQPTIESEKPIEPNPIMFPENEQFLDPEISNLPYLVVVVGVSNSTALTPEQAKNYDHNNGTYFEVETVSEAMLLIQQVYPTTARVFVVHVPNLQVTPGNPGSCWLQVAQIPLLEDYRLGWIIGGNEIIPDDFKLNLEPCFP